MFGDLRLTILPLWYFRTVGFYLGRGVTWVVCFNGCGLPDLICFNEVTLCFMHLTYVLAVPGYK